MALPAALLSPLVLRLIAMGATAATLYAASRRGPERVDMQSEDALDRLHDGVDLRLDPAHGRGDAEARMRRSLRLGRDGPGIEIDLAGLARLRARRLPRR